MQSISYGREAPTPTWIGINKRKKVAFGSDSRCRRPRMIVQNTCFLEMAWPGHRKFPAFKVRCSRRQRSKLRRSGRITVRSWLHTVPKQ